METLSVAYLNKTEFLVEAVGGTQLCSAFWASPQVQLGCGVMMAHFVAVHCLFIFLTSLQVFPVSLKNLADTFLVLCLVPCCWIENYCRHFFFLYEYFRFLRLLLWFKWTSGTTEKKEFIPSPSEKLAELWSIRRHCMWKHAAYFIKVGWSGILANMLWCNQTTFLKLKAQVRTANPKDQEVRITYVCCRYFEGNE